MLLHTHLKPKSCLGSDISSDGFTVFASRHAILSSSSSSVDDDVIPGNMGMLDQKLAMEWVRDNIDHSR